MSESAEKRRTADLEERVAILHILCATFGRAALGVAREFKDKEVNCVQHIYLELLSEARKDWERYRDGEEKES